MIGVCIVTYNQEQYIAQAIESVLIQEDCGHEVVIYVGEDNSTDRTGAICDEYASRSFANSLNPSFAIKVFHNEKNLGLVGNTMNLLNIMREDGCDYIAMLDGDDYWSDPKKLQKQVAYFDAHPEYGLVHTYVDSLYPDGLHRAVEYPVQEGDVWPLIGSYSIGNCSVVFRTQLLDMIDFVEFQNYGLRSCDYSMYAVFASKWQIGFIPEHTAVWRRGIESVSGTADMEKQIQYVQNDLAHWKYLSTIFPERWPYTEEDGKRYLHMCAFNIAYRFGNRERVIREIPLMSKDAQKAQKIKIICAQTWFSFYLYRLVKKIKSILTK